MCIELSASYCDLSHFKASKTLPENAKGHAVIQINSAADKQELEAPEGIKIIWLIEEQTSETLSQAVRSLTWLDGQVSVWTACEFESMRELRQYFRNEKEVAKENIYISSYWKRGVSEDGHKVIKQQDAQALAD